MNSLQHFGAQGRGHLPGCQPQGGRVFFFSMGVNDEQDFPTRGAAPEKARR
jgi:hypothetical protein